MSPKSYFPATLFFLDTMISVFTSMWEKQPIPLITIASQNFYLSTLQYNKHIQFKALQKETKHSG